MTTDDHTTDTSDGELRRFCATVVLGSVAMLITSTYAVITGTLSSELYAAAATIFLVFGIGFGKVWYTTRSNPIPESLSEK